MAMKEIRSDWNEQASVDHVYAAIGIPKTKINPMQTLNIDDVPFLRSILADAQAVLDVGCGYGRTIIPVSTYCRGTTVGIDLSDEMLERAREYSNHANRKPALIHASAHKLPFRPEVFDIVYSLLVFQHLPRNLAKESVDEVWHVLKQGGLACIQFPNAFTFDSILALLLKFVWTRILRRPLRPSFMRFYTRKQIKMIFRKFNILRIRGSDFSLLPSSIALYRRRIIIPIPRRYFLSSLSRLLQRESQRHSSLVNLAFNFLAEGTK